MALCAIIVATMVGAMAKLAERMEDNDLVQRAKTQAEALGRLYEMYYERIFRFCVYRLFNKEIAEDVTSAVFLQVARGIRSFKGRSEQDFRNWLYAIAANQANAYIRKASRREKLLAEAAGSIRPAAAGSVDPSFGPDWPGLYAAILKLKPKHQTIVTLRFFENFSYEQIANILDVKEANVRVTLHRILNKLRNQLQTVYDGEI
jgi:RNA polymerase sigma-70 factor (ECF subfamily)